MVDESRRTIRRGFARGEVFPVIGVYDVFSASLSAKYFDGIFVGGFSFAASHYGLPDIGLISWTDIVDLVRRIRTILPDPYILVDIDDGYADVEVARHPSLPERGGSHRCYGSRRNQKARGGFCGSRRRCRLDRRDQGSLPDRGIGAKDRQGVRIQPDRRREIPFVRFS
jgi:hypothetical protein